MPHPIARVCLLTNQPSTAETLASPCVPGPAGGCTMQAKHDAAAGAGCAGQLWLAVAPVSVAGAPAAPEMEETPKAADRPGTSLASTCSRASE